LHAAGKVAEGQAGAASAAHVAGLCDNFKSPLYLLDVLGKIAWLPRPFVAATAMFRRTVLLFSA
jgi:hypothetical protein